MKGKSPIFYSALLLTGVNLLLRLAGTSFQVYLSARLGPAGMGLMQLVLSVSAMALTAGSAGIRTATMYLTARELGRQRPEHRRSVLGCCALYSLVCSALAATALICLAPWLARYWIGNSQAVAALRTVALCLPVSCLCGVLTGYFTAARRIHALAAVEVAEQAVSIGATVLMLQLGQIHQPAQACRTVVLGSGIGAAVCLISLCALLLGEKGPWRRPRNLGKRLLSTALPLALADDLKAGINTAENLMVPRRLALFPGTAEPLAAFGTVSGMVFPILMFPASILFGLAELLIPELARCHAAGSQRRIRYLTRRTLRLGLLYGFCLGALELLLSDWLGQTLYGSREAGYWLALFAPLIPMLYCDCLTDAMIKGLGQQTASVRYNIFTSALDVALLFILLPRLGMKGYLFSFFITHGVNFALSLRRLLRITGIRLPLRQPLLSGIACLLAVSASALAQPIWLRSCGFLAIFLCLLTLFRVVGKEDLLWLRGLIRLSKNGMNCA